MKMFTDWVNLSGTSKINIRLSVLMYGLQCPWFTLRGLEQNCKEVLHRYWERFLINNFTCIPMIIIVNVLSCKGPSTLITKFISVKLLTRVDFLSSPTPSSTVTNLRRLNTDSISFPSGWRSDILNTL